MKAIKITLYCVTALLIAFVGVCGIYARVYSPEYIARCLKWGVLGVGLEEDRQAAAHLIKAGSKPFYFSPGSAEDDRNVKQTFEAVFHTDNLETFLASTGTKAFLVIQDDRLLYEQYFNGAGRDSEIISNSATKSFVSALIGIAINDGKIRSVDDPVTQYLPELAGRDPRFNQLTIRHLLRMSSGLRYTDYFFFTSDSSLSGASPDLRYAALHYTEMVDDPGLHFLYNDFNPQLLGVLLERATGMQVSDYLEQRIWGPIGMEYGASWDVDSQQSGFEMMQGGLHARAIDFVKFGRLYLQHGKWEGQVIVPEAWVSESTREDTTIDREEYFPKSYWVDFSKNLFYGYLWWGLSHAQSSDFYAMGKNGQMIYMSPAKNLIIVRLGERGTAESTWYEGAYQFAEQFK